MQSNRLVGFVFLVVLVIGAVLAWQLIGGAPSPVAPDPGTSMRPAVDAAAGDPGAGVDAATTTIAGGNQQVVREAVTVDPTASDLPSIVGQVVGPDQRPLADAEILCMQGSSLAPDFDNLDLDDASLFDPQAMSERMRRQLQERVIVHSDAEGRFRVRVDGTSRTVGMRILARGHLVLDRTAPRPSDRDVDLGPISLEAGAVVAGRVLDAAGNPVAGARVARMLDFENGLPGGMDFQVPGMDAWSDLRVGDSSITDDAGSFELAHVEAGDFTLRARHADHPTAKSAALTVAKGKSLLGITVTMARGAEIRGTVVGIPGGTQGLRVMAAAKQEAANDPTGGLMGMIGDASAMLDDMGMAFSERQADIAADGTFVVRGLAAGSTYRLWVGQEGRGFTGSGVSSKRVEAAADSFGVELRYEPGITVTFVVVDAASGEPVERLWVRDQLRGGGGLGDLMAFAPSQARQKPYPAGKVTVANLRPKEKQKLRLTIDAIGYAQLQRDDIELPTSGNLDLGTLELEPRPVLHVTVLSAQADRPVAGARVELGEHRQGGGRDAFAALAQMGRGSNPRSGKTDAAGQCTLNLPDSEIGELTVTARGHAPATVEVPLAADGVKEQVVRLVVGGSADITVLDPDQQPIEGANVEHRTPTGDTDRRRSDANGLVQFTNLVPGQHDFRITKDDGNMLAAAFGRRSADDKATEAAWQSVEVVDQQVATLTLEKAPTARLRGVVRENGVPLSGATVAFREGQAGEGPDAVAEGIMTMMGQMGGGTRRQGKSGDDGSYELEDLPSGAHSLRITHGDRAMATTIDVTLRDGENMFDVALEMTALRGVVRDSQGQPVDGATVTVAIKRDGNDERAQVDRLMAGMLPGMGLGGSSVTTDASGAFELRGVAADVALEVRATAKGLAPASVEATVARGQTRSEVDLQLAAAGRIEVTVAKPGMFAAVQAKFIGPDAASVAPVMQVLRRGKGALEGLRPGTWEVTYQGMNRNGESAPKLTVEVQVGQTATVEF